MKLVKLSDEELQALVNLVDQGVRQAGLRMARQAAVIQTRLEQAEEVEEPQESQEKEG